MWVIAQRGRIGHVNPGACHIDRGVEGVAAASRVEAPVSAAGHLDHDLADGDDAFLFVAHAQLPGHPANPIPAGTMAAGLALGNVTGAISPKDEWFRASGSRRYVIL